MHPAAQPSKPKCDDDCGKWLALNYIPEGVCEGIGCPIYSPVCRIGLRQIAGDACNPLFIRTVLCHLHPELQKTGPAHAETGPAYHVYAAQNIEGEGMGGCLGPLALTRYRASRSARGPTANVVKLPQKKKAQQHDRAVGTTCWSL